MAPKHERVTLDVQGVGDQAIEENPDDPPVVARMVVEIRSDGTRTIARGALEDVESGQTVGVETRADSPVALVLALARAVRSAPFLGLNTEADEASAGSSRGDDEVEPSHGRRSVRKRLRREIGRRISRRLRSRE